MTVVVLMGLAHIQTIAARLIERGWNLMTPVAVLFSASRDDADVWTTTFGDLQRGAELPDRAGPGTIVIGDVVRVRALLGTRESAPDSITAEEPAIARSRTHGSH
jgi:siroheme synthase